MQPRIQTYSGIMFDLENPTAEMVRLEDIAHALANSSRFNGHTARFYSIAQHSCICTGVMREAAHKPWALFHDAAEAYVGDVVAPLKSLLAPTIHQIETRAQGAIVARFEIDVSQGVQWAVRVADLRMLATEQRDLLGPQAEPWELEFPPYDFHITQTWSPHFAKRVYLDMARQLLGLPVPAECHLVQ